MRWMSKPPMRSAIFFGPRKACSIGYCWSSSMPSRVAKWSSVNSSSASTSCARQSLRLIAIPSHRDKLLGRIRSSHLSRRMKASSTGPLLAIRRGHAPLIMNWARLCAVRSGGDRAHRPGVRRYGAARRLLRMPQQTAVPISAPHTMGTARDGNGPMNTYTLRPDRFDRAGQDQLVDVRDLQAALPASAGCGNGRTPRSHSSRANARSTSAPGPARR